MNWIFTADWHISFKKPRIRTDNYAEVQFQKIKFICDYAKEMDASIIVAGDIFDRPTCPLPWLYRYMELFQSVPKGIYVIYGQHDIHFHNPDLTKTPLGVLVKSGALKWASDVMDVLHFGKEKPDTFNHSRKWLCAHFPVTKDKPPFFMEDALSAKQFMKFNDGYDVIITGDFHEQHTTTEKEQRLFNPGPIMRTSKDKQNFEPKFIVYDDEVNDFLWVDIPHEKDVFDLDLMDKDDRKDYRDRLREFASSIETSTEELNFANSLKIVVKETRPSKRVMKIIDDVMEGI